MSFKINLKTCVLIASVHLLTAHLMTLSTQNNRLITEQQIESRKMLSLTTGCCRGLSFVGTEENHDKTQ
jgi:hypothetical protein